MRGSFVLTPMRNDTILLIKALFLSLVFLFVSLPAMADGILVPPIDIPVRDAFAINYHRVNVSIQDGVVRTEIDQQFENLTGRRIEATYVFPIPAGAVLENFSMWVNGDKISGIVLPARDARQIYEDVVRKQRDPALLEYIGKDAFRARVFPIEPREKKRIQLSYTQVVKSENGVYEYVYPLNTEKFSAQTIEEVTISGVIESSIPLKTVYSPSHSISVNRSDDARVNFSYEENDVRPEVDFVLYYSVDPKEIGASVLAYDADDSEDGFFLATITPRVESRQAKIISKNFIFVLDKSGSMASDGKIDQAKGALEFVLRSLNVGDRFNVIAYSDSLWTCFEEGLRTWGVESRDDALKFVRGFDAEGGTNINESLLRAVELLKSESGSRPSYIVFLTDGLPTVGVTDEDEIFENFTVANNGGARLFAFGVGYDVNTHLLDKLTEKNHGVTEYVRPNEDIEVKVSALYSKISSPVLTDVKIRFNGVRVKELFPREMPDLFKGNQIILSGRYSSGGRAEIVLEGKVDGARKVYEFPVNFASRANRNFIPRVWAGRKIGYLADELRLHGTNDELIAEVVRLSKRYGIITEYTSFLIREEDAFFAREEEQLRRALDATEAVAEAKSGAGAVGQAQTSQTLKGQTAGGQGGANAPGAYYNVAGEKVQVQTIKYVGDQTFFFVDGYWTDSRYDKEKQKLIEVKTFSDAYFELARKSEAFAKLASLGDQIIVVLADKTALKVSVNAGKEHLSPDELANAVSQLNRQVQVK